MQSWELSQRLQKLPPYLFAEIDAVKSALRKKGVDFIDLSVGDPDLMAPPKVISALARAAKKKENQKYSLDQGKQKLRESIRDWMKKRFSVRLDAVKEIIPTIGSKEALVHFPLAVVNPGEYVLFPNPGYPGYRGAALFAGAKPYEIPLLEKNNFLPELGKIPIKVRDKTKVLYLNYPHNPTTALAPKKYLEEVVAFCRKYGIILAYDNAYSEIYFEHKPLSILQIKGAKDVAIEFHSFSKTFCMTGFRVGWACGNCNLVKHLLKVKTNVDSGIFGAVQESAIAALEVYNQYTAKLRETFKQRRDAFIELLKAAGMKDYHAHAGFYVWVKIPAPFTSSMNYAKYLMTKKNIVATPGVGFGVFGEGYIRFALTIDKKRIQRISSL